MFFFASIVFLISFTKRCFSQDPWELANCLPSYPNCGKDYDGYRIFGDHVAPHGEHPWSAFIFIDNDRDARCGGSLINSQFILTAGHCFDPIEEEYFNNIRKLKEKLNVELGQWDLDETLDCPDVEDCDPSIRVYGRKIIRHEKYGRRSDMGISYYINDIALVKFVRPIEFTKYIRPVCLINNDILLKKKVLRFTSFGKINDEELSSRKMYMNLKIVECKTDREDKNVTFCAQGKTDPTAKTCKGDSGNAAILSGNYAVGILIMGPDTCDASINMKSTFIKIGAYLNWIKENIKEFI